MMKNIREAVEILKKLKLIEKQVLDDIVAKIDKFANDESDSDYHKLGKNICVVSFDTIQKNKFILSPSLYLPDAQCEAIKKEYAKCNGNIVQILAKTRAMIEDKYVANSSSKGDKTLLNNKTIALLKEIAESLSPLETI